MPLPSSQLRPTDSLTVSHSQVKYTADQSGFHAEIDTNEPGTANENPADVVIRSTAPSAHQSGGQAPGQGQRPSGGQRTDSNRFASGSASKAPAPSGRSGGYANPNAEAVDWDQ